MAEKKKSGLMGKMFHKDRPSSTPDSTYGSEGSRSSYNSTADAAPSVAGSDNSGQPYVNDQGQVVTTTTTTTTTVTTNGPASHTSGPHSSNLANKLDPRVDSTQVEHSEPSYNHNYRNDATSSSSTAAPIIPNKSSMRERSPNPPLQANRQQQQQQQHPYIAPQATQAPPLQNVDGYGMPGSSSSPSGRHNFSYPSRTPPPAGNGFPAPTHEKGSTLQGLKTAAVGIHGAGETLRGTLNSAMDRRLHASAETIARDQAVANAGKQEIESGRLSDYSRQQGGVGNPVKGILRKRDPHTGAPVAGAGHAGGAGPGPGHVGASGAGNPGLRVVNE